MHYHLSIQKGFKQSARQGEIISNAGEKVPIRANVIALKNEKDAIVGGLATFHDLTLEHQLDQVIRDRYTFHDMIGKSPEENAALPPFVTARGCAG